MIAGIWGLLLSTVVAAAVATLSFALSAGGSVLNFSSFDWRFLGLVFAFSGVIGAACMIVIFVPATYVLSKQSTEHAWQYVPLGLAVGAFLPWLLLSDIPLRAPGVTDLVFLLGLGGIPGMAGGLVWWLMVRRRVSKLRTR